MLSLDRQHAGMTVITKIHTEVAYMRTASAASTCSAANAIHILIQPNSLKPLFGTPIIIINVQNRSLYAS